MKTDYEELKELVDKIDVLIDKQVTASDTEFQDWKICAELFLVRKYGKDSFEYGYFTKIKFVPPTLWRYGMNNNCGADNTRDKNKCKEGLELAKDVFLKYLEELEEENVTPIPEKALSVGFDFSKVFIVHGHDDGLKYHVAEIIKKQGIEPVILSEQTNRGRTIIEKFEEYSDVGGAICLFTSDDLGRSKKDDREQARARQNVVFETGYFMGKLGRKHTIILADKGVDMPSDLSGVVYTDSINWQVDLLKELEQMGYTIDLNKLKK